MVTEENTIRFESVFKTINVKGLVSDIGVWTKIIIR